MNKIFKVIWSKARNCYVVVSELAKSHDDGHVRRSRSGCCRKVAILAALALTTSLAAGPVWAADSKENINNVVTIKDNQKDISAMTGINNLNGTGNVVYGTGNTADKSGAVIVGKDSIGNKDSVVIGNNAKSNAENQIIIGHGTANGSAIGSIIIGNTNNTVDTSQSVLIGNNTKANGSGQGIVIIGNGAIADSNAAGYTDNGKYIPAGIVLGEYSYSNTRAGKEGFLSNKKGDRPSEAYTPEYWNAVWKATANPMAIGNVDTDASGKGEEHNGHGVLTRQITGVAAGTDLTDAVNVAQLKAAVAQFSGGGSGTGGSGVHDYSVKSVKPDTDTNYKNKGATGDNALAAGVSASAIGAQSVAVGNSAQAIGAQSVAVGNNAQAIDQDSIALGTNAKAEGKGAAAIGQYNTASGQNSLAFGGGYNKEQKGNTASGVASVAFGEGTQAIAEGTLAFGENTQAGSTEEDNQGNLLGQNAVAFGNGTKATGGRSLAFGERTVASANDATAFGNESIASKTGATAFGNKNQATGLYATAWGGGDKVVKGDGTTSKIGTVASGIYATAFGERTVASEESATAFGSDSTASGKNSLAFGENSTAAAQNSLAALGGTVETDAKNAAAIGSRAKATLADSIALGSNSVADRAAGVTGYDAATGAATTETSTAWVSNASAIAVGNGSTTTRQITGVAAGSEDTDAVNLAQLKTVSAMAAKHTTVSVGSQKAMSDGNTVKGGNLEMVRTTKDGQANYDVSLSKDVVLGEQEENKGGSLVVNSVAQFRTAPGSKDTYPVKEAVKIDGTTVSVVKNDGTNDQRQVVLGVGQDVGGYVALFEKTGKTPTYIFNAISHGITYLKDKDSYLTPDPTNPNAERASNEFNRLEYGDITKGSIQFIATLDDGQKYAGDNYQAAKTEKKTVDGKTTTTVTKEEQNVLLKKLNERLDIKGGADEKKLTEKNIGVNVDSTTGVMKVQLAQNLDLTDTGSVKMGNTTIKNGGVTITPTGVTEDKEKISLTDKGLSNGGKQITHVDSGLKEANGNTVDLAAASGDVLNNAVNVGDLQKVQNIASAHTTVSVGGQKAQKDGKEVKGGNLILTRTQDADTHAYNYDVKLGNDITVGEKGEPGKNGVDGKIGVNGKTGSSVVINGKDGSIGLKGTDGANGLTIKGAAGKVGVDGKDGETRIVYEEGDKNHTLATLDDGQKYHGDFGETANVALNHQVNIVGDISSYNANHPDSKVKQSALTDGTANVCVETTKDDQGNATLTIKLNKNLTGLESVTAGGAKLGTHQDGDSSLAVHEIDANGNSVPKTDDNGKTVTDKAGTYVTGLTNKAWDGKTYVSGRAATEDQLMQITSSIVNQGATGGFGLSANGQNVKQDLGKTIAINGDGTYSPDGKETKAGNISTSVEKGAIKVFLNKDLNINSTTMEGKDKDSNTVSNVTNAEGSTITKTDANGKQSSTTVNAGSLTIKDGDGTTTIGGGKATIGGVTINGTGENDGSDQHKSTIKGLSNTTFDTTHLNQYNKSDRAATEGQLKDVYDMASKHTTVTVNGEYAPSTDGNLILKKEDKNGSANYDLALNNDITLGDKDSNGKLTVKSNDGTKSIITDGEKGTLTFKNGNDETSMKAADSAKGFDGTTDIKRVAVDGHTVATMDDGMKFAGDSGEALKQKLNSTTNIKGGAAGELSDGNIGVVSDGKDTLTVKLAKNIRGLDSVEATTVNATTVNSSSFNIAGDSNHSAITIQQGNVNMGGNTISGVAPGKVSADSMDAVNGSQLWQRDQAINGLSGSVNKLGNRINRVGAGAAALAALHPLDFDPDDKWDFAAGYGNYRGANAAAVGAYYRPNEDTMFSVGGSFGGGENMVNAGVSFKVGQGNHVSTSRVAMAKEIKDLRQNVANLNAIVNRQSALIDKLTGTNAGMIKDKGNDLFPDVPANHWAYEYVTKLKHAGILTGYPDGNFDGDRMMTRYEFAAIVYRAIMAGAASNPALNQDGTLDKLANEFSSEMKYIRIDTIAKDKNGKPTIERVRVISDAK